MWTRGKEEATPSGPRQVCDNGAARSYSDAIMPRDDVRNVLKRTGMPSYTETTITSARGFVNALDWAAEHGYALNEGEQEPGVRCVAPRRACRAISPEP